MELKGKTALVTGAAKRVGREIALTLAEKGCDILLHYNTSRTDAEKTAADIRALGVKTELLQADLGKSKEIVAMTLQMDKSGLAADILVNSASLYFKTPLPEAKESDWDALFDANLKGPFFLSKEIGLRMAKRKSGKIVNIADWSGMRPYRDFAAYCATKGGLLTLTKSLARDLAPHVQANAVAPGPVLRPPDMPDAEAEAIAKTTALGRWGTPKDVACAVRFLVENDFMNGTVIVVDGGRSIV